MISQENLLRAAVLGHMPDDVLKEAGVDPEFLEGLVDEPERLDEVLRRFLERSSRESVSWLLHRIMKRGGQGLKDAIFVSQVIRAWFEENREVIDKAWHESKGGLSFVLKIRSLTENAIRPGVEHS